MRRAAALVRQRAQDIAPIFTMELGKTINESLAEIERSATFLDWDSEEIRRLYGRIVPTDPPIQQFVVREPIGPVAAFTPWNVPMSAPSRKISASLAAGCSIILKPASETPATACLFAQCFIDAGLPKGVLNVVFGDSDEVSRTLIMSPVTRLVSLTGSVNVGRRLMLLAAEAMKPTLMELGGHAPVLIDENVNHDEIAQLAINWKYRMAGQFCSAPSRYLIHRSKYHEFVESLASKAAALKVGDGFAEGIQMGPLVNRRRLHDVTTLVEDAVSRGARVATGGSRLGNRGWFYAPTVLADVPLDARLMHEEPFGPVSPCIAVDSMDDALAISNRSSHGPGCFRVHQLDSNRRLPIARIASRLSCSQCLYKPGGRCTIWRQPTERHRTGRRTRNVPQLHRCQNHCRAARASLGMSDMGTSLCNQDRPIGPFR